MPQLAGDHFPTFDVACLSGQQGDENTRSAEWERAFGHFQPRLLSYFARRAAGVLPLEDLLQEIWLRAFLNVGSLSSGLALWTWLVTIGNNLLRDELRRNRPTMESLHKDENGRATGIAEFVGVAMQSDGGALADRIDEMRSRLQADEWEFLNLLCVDNLSHEEVAMRLGLKTSMASRQRLRRLRQRLLG